MMKKIILSTMLIFTMIMTPLFSYGDELTAKEIKNILSLEQAIEEGIKNSPQIEINELEVEAKKVELSEARYHEKKYKKSDFSLGTVEGFLLDANMLSKKAEYALQEERLKKDYIIEDIKYNVTKAYYGVLKAKGALDVTKSSLDNLQRTKDMVKKKFELGVASKSDRYKVKFDF